MVDDVCGAAYVERDAWEERGEQETKRKRSKQAGKHEIACTGKARGISKGMPRSYTHRYGP